MVGALVLLVVLLTPPSQDDVLKIGLVASQNGSLIPWGVDSIRGAQLAVDQVNKDGGINGRKVQLLVEDSASTPEGGLTATKKLIADGVVGLLGEVSSGITQPMAMVSTEHNIPHVVIGGTKPNLVESENVFRVCYTDEFQGHAMATFAYKDLGLRRMAIVTDKKQPYSYNLSSEFRQHFKKLGGSIVAEEFYQSRQVNFSEQIYPLIASKPHGVFLSGFFNEVGPFVRQAGQLGLEGVKYLGGDGWASAELISSGGNEIVGGFFSAQFNNHWDTRSAKKFVEAWKKKHNEEPGTTMGALGYDAALVLIDAIKRAGTTDSEAVIKALGTTANFQGATGSITLTPRGDARRSSVITVVERDGFYPATVITYEDVYGKGG